MAETVVLGVLIGVLVWLALATTVKYWLLLSLLRARRQRDTEPTDQPPDGRGGQRRED